MRRNLTVISLSLSLLFVGMTALVYYYPNQVTVSLLGLNITNNLALYMGATAALLFAVIAFGAGLVGRGAPHMVPMGDCCGHDHMDGCISGIYHDEATGLMVCLNCGTGLKQDFIACPTCGQEVYQDCPGCQEIIPTWYNVCPYCGYDLVVFEITPIMDEPAPQAPAATDEE